MRRALAICVVLALTVPGVPAGASAADPVPRDPLITDPAGDANGLTFMDQTGPGSRPEADLLAAWFTADETTLNAHWHIAASPLDKRITVWIRTNPHPDLSSVPDTRVVVSRCIALYAVFPSADDGWDPYAYGSNGCDESGLQFPATPRIRNLSDGSAVITVGYRLTKAFPIKHGDVLTRPFASSRDLVIVNPTSNTWETRSLDSTERGEAYVVP